MASTFMTVPVTSVNVGSTACGSTVVLTVTGFPATIGTADTPYAPRAKQTTPPMTPIHFMMASLCNGLEGASSTVVTSFLKTRKGCNHRRGCALQPVTKGGHHEMDRGHWRSRLFSARRIRRISGADGGGESGDSQNNRRTASCRTDIYGSDGHGHEGRRH